MTNLLNIFTPATNNIFFVSAITGVVGLGLGFIIKAVSIARYKTRIASLEDEMLLNHSRILELEKQVTQLKEEKAELSNNVPLQKIELKAS